MSGPHETDVLVVGAGPTGLVAALSLAEAGLSVELIDEEWRPAGHSYALALHPRSLGLLAQLGLAQDAIAQGRKLESLTILAGEEPRATRAARCWTSASRSCWRCPRAPSRACSPTGSPKEAFVSYDFGAAAAGSIFLFAQIAVAIALYLWLVGRENR